MKYINLIDYVGKPELIQHVGGLLPVAVVDTSDSGDFAYQVFVVYQNGRGSPYTKDGRLAVGEPQLFILRPKTKRVVKGV